MFLLPVSHLFLKKKSAGKLLGGVSLFSFDCEACSMLYSVSHLLGGDQFDSVM